MRLKGVQGTISRLLKMYFMGFNRSRDIRGQFGQKAMTKQKIKSHKKDDKEDSSSIDL